MKTLFKNKFDSGVIVGSLIATIVLTILHSIYPRVMVNKVVAEPFDVLNYVNFRLVEDLDSVVVTCLNCDYRVSKDSTIKVTETGLYNCIKNGTHKPVLTIYEK
jgi:hypothetical protein